MRTSGWISITKAFIVECGLCDRMLDEVGSYAIAHRTAAEHRRKMHPGEGVTIGGTWGQNSRREAL